MTTLITNATLVTVRDGEAVILRDHAVLIEDGVIRAVTESGAASSNGIDEIIDARNHVVIPGLINTHHHLYQSLTRGLVAVQNAPLFTWLTGLYSRWRRMDNEAVKLGASVSIAELLLSGCTTTSDHFYVFPPGSGLRMEAALEAADELGIRIHACRGSMSVGQSSGGLPPDDCVEGEDDILTDCQRVIDEFHDPSPYAVRRIDLAPCSPFSISPELLRDTRDLARERSVLLHTHAAETLDEERYCVDRFGRRPMAFLADHGWLGEDVYLAHCVHLSDDEIDLLAETQTGISHCPCSNMRLGSGVAPVARLIEPGAKVGIGVDGSSSNGGGNLLAEARQALLLQRVGGGPAAITTAQAFELATTGGAAVLGRQRLGRIEPAMAADLVMYRKDDIALAGAIAQDPLGALMLCHAPRPDRVIVAGQTVVSEGHLANADEHALASQLNELVTKTFR
ncbi:MAG: 8-oxoguanine deaminase [Planctomycetota bacterium]|jgi:cytosine/adenosine deaminase-related metal-dependent hydrolase